MRAIRGALASQSGLEQGKATMSAAHILTYARHLEGGGVERAQLRLAREWLAEGRRVTLMLGRMAGPLAAELPAGIEIVAPVAGGTLSLASLADVVRERAPDVLFCAGNTYTSAAAWARARLGGAAPLIVGKMSNTSRRTDLGLIGGAAYRTWLRTHGLFLDHLVAMTPETAVRAGSALGMGDRVSVIANPPVRPLPGAVLAALPALPSPGRFILGVGRLAAQKRWDRLIAAMPALSDRHVSLVIVGEGDRRPALEAQIAALDLAGRVFLPGHSADPLLAMERAALLALPSDFEGVPGVLREALSVGHPGGRDRIEPVDRRDRHLASARQRRRPRRRGRAGRGAGALAAPRGGAPGAGAAAGARFGATLSRAVRRAARRARGQAALSSSSSPCRSDRRSSATLSIAVSGSAITSPRMPNSALARICIDSVSAGGRSTVRRATIGTTI